MTCLEKLKQMHPDWTDEAIGACVADHCPEEFGLMPDPDLCDPYVICDECWNREISGTEADPTPVIKDSGERRQFDTGAVRDIQEGKGRCDLMPLDVLSDHFLIHFGRDNHSQMVFGCLSLFVESGDCLHLQNLLGIAVIAIFRDPPTMFLEVSKHFEDGAKKYGENNWQKGIPVRCYIDSAVRHYLKWLRGDKDEPHDRAFCWNILCAIWTCKHKPDLNDYRQVKNENTCVCCGATIPEGWQYCNTCWENEHGGG